MTYWREITFRRGLIKIVNVELVDGPDHTFVSDDFVVIGSQYEFCIRPTGDGLALWSADHLLYASSEKMTYRNASDFVGEVFVHQNQLIVLADCTILVLGIPSLNVVKQIGLQEINTGSESFIDGRLVFTDLESRRFVFDLDSLSVEEIATREL